MTSRFEGFAPGVTGFLAELAANNDRAWFAENKPRYEAEVLAPALAFISAMAQPLAEFAPEFVAVAKRSGGSLMRVYRDVRFSKDKRPYKTNLGIQFRHRLGKDVHAPGYYFHLEPGRAFIAAGCWRPAGPALHGIREFLSDNPRGWARARDDALAGGFELAGDSLVRPPRGFAADHPAIDDLKRKDFMLLRELDPADLSGPDAVDRAAGDCRTATPFVAYLCAALDVPF